MRRSVLRDVAERGLGRRVVARLHLDRLISFEDDFVVLIERLHAEGVRQRADEERGA